MRIIKRSLVFPLRLIARYYLPLMALIALPVTYLNWQALGMAGLLPGYIAQKEIILSGFDFSNSATPAFPMWGYAWLMMISENQLILLLIQHGLNLLAIGLLIHTLTRLQLLPSRYLTILKVMLVFSLPWYAFHSLRWANSPAISFYLISFSLLLSAHLDKYLSPRQSLAQNVLAGLAWGVSLNFRSDYYLLPFLFAGVILFYAGFNRGTLTRIGAFLASLFLMMVPWLLYTNAAIGQPQFTSTNGGHVWFIGLGILPDNEWGITPYDGDPLMHQLILEEFGGVKPSTGAEASDLLMGEWQERVTEDPNEYARKVVYSAKAFATEGTYRGEFAKSPVLGWHGDPLEEVTGFVSSRAILVALILLPIAAWAMRRNLAVLLMVTGIVYQAGVNSFAYHMTSYTTNIYVFSLIGICYGVWAYADLLASLKERRRVMRPAAAIGATLAVSD